MIAGANRALLQRDRMWQPHSASWMLEYATWPIEWQQQTPMLAMQDYMSTGSADFAKAYSERLLNDTKHQYIDGTGVVGKIPQVMDFQGGHIVGWDPAPGSCDPKPDCVDASPFEQSDHETPCNAWTVHGLEVLSDLALRYGDSTAAAELAAAGLPAAMCVLARVLPKLASDPPPSPPHPLQCVETPSHRTHLHRQGLHHQPYLLDLSGIIFHEWLHHFLN